MNAPSASVRHQLRHRILTIHRWLSLAAMLFWLTQAITGMLLVFHWELTDLSTSSLHRPTDLAAIERRLEELAPPGSSRTVQSVWITAGLSDRYKITISDSADDSSEGVNIAGDGTVLRAGASGHFGFFGTAVTIHHTLLAGETGEWIVGISGILLLSNLVLGLIVAWPKRGQWRRALAPVERGGPAARLYSWHRAVGLWAVLPALLLVAVGVMLRFGDGTATLVGATAPSMPANPPAGPPIGFKTAVLAAKGAVPGSKLTAVAMPADDDATYHVRLLAPGEIRRAYGTSTVFVDANDGAVRGTFLAKDAPAPRAFMNGLYAVHTGEIGGLPGRLLVLSIGAWLASMTVIGALLWARRRKRPDRQS